MQHVLFICSRNRWRSPTAEQLFNEHPGIEVASAGLAPDAVVPVDPELLLWADVIFVMEPSRRRQLSQRFAAYLKNKRIVCLHIADDYGYKDDRLVEILKVAVPRYLRSWTPGG
jgi:predicted protein tyrosine phosphatase